MVPMRDGIKLATDIYRPANKNGIPIKGKYPTILGRTSYDKTNPVIISNKISHPVLVDVDSPVFPSTRD